MKQNTHNRQTLKLGSNKSQTSTHLYQSPTFADQHPSIKEAAVVQIKELVLVGLVILFGLICVAAPTFILKSCADEVDQQQARALKHQLQFANSTLEARQ